MKGPAIEHMERLDDELRRAARKGRAKAMQALIEQGAGVARADADGWTPLMHASVSGKAECVRILLPFVDPGAKTCALTMPLMLCAEDGWTEGVRLVLSAIESADERRGAKKLPPERSPARRRQALGRTALMLAAKAASAECARLLLPLSNANAADFDGKTALMWAAQADEDGAPECVGALLSASDPSKRDKLGRTALHIAARWGRPETVERLAEVVDPAISDANGKTAFDVSADRTNEDRESVRQALRRAMAEREGREIMIAANAANAAGESLRPLSL